MCVLSLLPHTESVQEGFDKLVQPHREIDDLNADLTLRAFKFLG